MSIKKIGGLVLMMGMGIGFGQAQEAPVLRVQPADANGWIRLEGTGEGGNVWHLEATENLQAWREIARTHDGLFSFADPGSAGRSARFYRVRLAPRGENDDWKNQIRWPYDEFLSAYTSAGDLRWLKFAIVLSDPERVYFQDSSKYVFHYDFAAKRLEPFIGLSRNAFDAVSLRANGQRVVLGAVLFPPGGESPEFGIQFVGLDPYPKEDLARWFALVKSAVAGRPGLEALYFPTFEQRAAAEADRIFFEGKGIRLSSTDRWIGDDQTYSQGWAIGRLKFFPAQEINRAFAEGRLTPRDILLTDGVPAEIPILAGVVTLAPSTPNSHTAILARSFGIPFAYLAGAWDQAVARSLVDRDVALKAGRIEWGGRVELFALNAAISPALKNEILAAKEPPPIQITPKQSYGRFWAGTDGLVPADIKYFGGKAANYGLLRQSIPSNSPVAIAFSFDLWDGFLEQTLPSGKTLRAEIEGRLAGYTYPPDMPALAGTLAGIRKLITDTAKFSLELQSAVTNALGAFEPGRKIRFRSSTNMEDSEQFSGAGLYDSFSGCLADDLDGDQAGPSRCDPAEAKERGVFRAIQKVYASFYNDNAYLERLRHRVKEADVGMGVLVHYSAPDIYEMANGVAALRVLVGEGSTNYMAELVSQSGAVSVSNPDTAVRPEVVVADRFAEETYFTRRQGSGLLQLGASVLDWEKDYRDLMKLLYAATDRFRAYFPAKTNFTLDFEYKKLEPGVLSVKQIRQIPAVPDPRNAPRYFLDQTNAFMVLQSEFADVFSIHRLKSEMTLHTRDFRLSDTNLAASLYEQVRLTRVVGTEVRVMEGKLPEFPGATFGMTNRVSVDSWIATGGSEPWKYTLITELLEPSGHAERTLVTLRDGPVRLRAEFATPLPVLDWEGNPATTTSHEVLLEPVFSPDSLSVPVEREARGENGLVVNTRFFWYRQGGSGLELKTAPLLRWEETRISGLISRPLVLKGFYSQTYHPYHHNHVEEFIFEPRLEPGLDPADLAELQAANVQLVYIRVGEAGRMIRILGLDGKFRAVKTEEVDGKQ